MGVCNDEDDGDDNGCYDDGDDGDDNGDYDDWSVSSYDHHICVPHNNHLNSQSSKSSQHSMKLLPT